MKNILVLSLLMLATTLWAAGQQSGAAPQGDSGQNASPSMQTPQTTPPQSAEPGATTPTNPQSGAPGASPEENVTVTEGCLGGANPNYTITDATGTTYRLNIPPGADASSLQAHVGEPVAVLGGVNSGPAANHASIDVAKIARGKGQCPSANNSTGTPPPAAANKP
jgi:hypothetical protein